VEHKKTKLRRACKQIVITRPSSWELVSREIQNLQTLDHPNILQLIETYHDFRKIYLITELCEGGALIERIIHQYARLRQPITELQVSIYMRQILSDTQFCHDKGIIHRDIKPENILFLNDKPDSDLKVIDFGLAATIDAIAETRVEYTENRSGIAGAVSRILSIKGRHLMNHQVKRVKMERAGTPHYMAPEMIRGEYDSKCDVFSIGVIMYQLLTGIHPFYEYGIDNEGTVKQKILKHKPPFTGAEWTYVSQSARDLVAVMLCKDPLKRPSAAEALKHPWFRHVAQRNNVGSQSALTHSVFENLKTWSEVNGLKQEILKLLARELSEKNIDDLRRKFKALDKAQDGTIGIDQLRESMTQINYTMSDEHLQDVLRSLDGDATHRIHYTDFVAALLAKRKNFEEVQLQEMFNKLDINRQGKVDLEGMKGALSLRFNGHSEQTLQRIFEEVDKNGDGYVDYEEFHLLMTS